MRMEGGVWYAELSGSRQETRQQRRASASSAAAPAADSLPTSAFDAMVSQFPTAAATESRNYGDEEVVGDDGMHV